jgi:hypothetical protein
MNYPVFLQEGAMNAKIGLVVVAAVALLAAACGSSSSSAASSASSPTYPQEVALAQCMRSHGLPDFPDPDPSTGGFSSSVLSTFDDSQGQAAYSSCRHLLGDGAPSLARLEQLAQQEQTARQKALPELLKLSQCVRSHGVPNFPDPTPSGLNLNGTGINPSSPQFQAALKACQKAAPGLHISVHSSSSSQTS